MVTSAVLLKLFLKLLWPITTHAKNAVNQSEFKANTCNRGRVGKNACEQVTIGQFGFAFDWLRKQPRLF